MDIIVRFIDNRNQAKIKYLKDGKTVYLGHITKVIKIIQKDNYKT